MTNDASTAAAGPAYRAARAGAAFMDRSDRVRVEFTGPQAAASLNGLLTNDIAALKPGSGLYAAALTAKGKIIADVRVFARTDAFLVDTPATASASLLTMLRKYVNPRLAKYRDVSAETCTIGVFGPHAAAAAAAATGVPAATLAAMLPFAHVSTIDGPAAVLIASVPDLGVTGFDVIAPRATAEAIRAALVKSGALELDAESAERLRIEAGRPLYGADMDENVLAQEAGLDRLGAISFDKGCYTGQETVARVHFRGHVNRTLRGLRSPDPIATGAELIGADGAIVGTVRSTTVSPALGAIALAYVRREIEDGTTLTVRSGAGTAGATGAESSPAIATVVPLPF